MDILAECVVANSFGCNVRFALRDDPSRCLSVAKTCSMGGSSRPLLWLPLSRLPPKIFPQVTTRTTAPPAVVTQTASTSFVETETAASENTSATVAELPVEIPTVPVSRNASAGAVRINENLAGSLLVAYLLFGLYRAFKLFRAWRRTKAMIRSAYPLPIPDQFQSILARCQNILGVTRLGILFSEKVPVPVTAGIFHPAIILPEQLLSEQDADVLCSALGHELVHVARRDYLLNLLYELLYLPLAFHPAAGQSGRRRRSGRPTNVGDDGFLEGAKRMVEDTLAHSSEEEKGDYGVIKEKIRADLKRYISKQSQKRPLIMPVILEI